MPKVPGAGTNQELAARSSPTWQSLGCRCSSLAAREGLGWGARPRPRTSLSLLLCCLPLPARCWEPTGSAGAGAVLPPAGVPTPHLLSAPGGSSSWARPVFQVNMRERGSSRKGTPGERMRPPVLRVPHPGTAPGTVRLGQPCPRNAMSGGDGGGSSEAEPQGTAGLPGCSLQGNGPKGNCTGTRSSPEPGPGDAQGRDPSPAESCCWGTGFRAKHKSGTGTAQLCLHQGTPSAPLN